MLKAALLKMTQIFSLAILQQGQMYQKEGHVLGIRLSDGLMKARVKGSSGQIYDVHMDLKSWPQMSSRCSCLQKVNCKHAAASLFALQERENCKSNGLLAKTTEDTESSNLFLPHTSRIKTHDILYILTLSFNNNHNQIMLNLALAKCLKKKKYSKKKLFTTTYGRQPYFREEDDEIFAEILKKTNRLDISNTYIFNAELLEKILLTERAFLSLESVNPVRRGKTLNATLHWEINQNNQQHPILKVNQKNIKPLFLEKLWYYDEVENKIGPLETLYSLESLRKLFHKSPFELGNVHREIEEILKEDPFLPRPYYGLSTSGESALPKPIVVFSALELNHAIDHETMFSTPQSFLLIVHLYFSYHGTLVDFEDKRSEIFYQKEDHLIKIRRHLNFEKEQYQKIDQLLSLRAPSLHEKLAIQQTLKKEKVLSHYPSEMDIPRLRSQVFPLLKKHGFEIEINHFIYEDIIEADDIEWYSNIKEQPNDFFAYELGILIDEKPVNIVPLVTELIKNSNLKNLYQIDDEKVLKLRLETGKILKIRFGRIKPLIFFLLQYFSKIPSQEKPLLIKDYQFLLIEETEAAIQSLLKRKWDVDQFQSKFKQLSELKTLPTVEIPLNFKGTLRDYQQQGLNWLQYLRTNYFGGILADDMGLGKTVQTLVNLQVEKEKGRQKAPSLIITPTSLAWNWMEEAKHFTPNLKVLLFHGSSRHPVEFHDYDVIISTYGLIQRDKSRFIDFEFYYLILDEAQIIKNSRTKTTQIVQQINAAHRLCLSGTPFENHLGEFWSLFNFLMPGLLGNSKNFNTFFKKPIEIEANMERRMMLTKRVQPFILRRTKNEVIQELPPKTEITQRIELIGPQRDLYEAIRMSMEKKVRDAIAKQGIQRSQITILDALLKLRQVCCDPRLLNWPQAKMVQQHSAKLKALLDLVETLQNEGRRILIFSQFTSMLRLMEESFKNYQFSYLKLTGQTQNRQQVIQDFQNGKAPIFLISLKAGGKGLNLTRADTVIHYDPWWNPAVEDQATDRSYRIGQENPVFVYKFITVGTVEEAILTLQERKRSLFKSLFMEGFKEPIQMTEHDLDVFFKPFGVE